VARPGGRPPGRASGQRAPAGSIVRDPSFVTSSATGISLDKVYSGVTPFWITLIVANALVILFPDIALFLPGLMKG
jgi:hypothetical protein